MPTSQKPLIRIATRASNLALWQANHVADLQRAAVPHITVEIVHVTTTGDTDQIEPLRSFGGMGVFTREVQKAVLDGRADIAVHSLKDLPTETAVGLSLAAVPERADTADALVLPKASNLAADMKALPPHARLGTGSLRRQAQLLYLRPDFQLLEVRGNVETRLRKLDEGQYDALILAAAGLTRLGLADRISATLGPPAMFPAVGQGALGIECRADDELTCQSLAILDHAPTRARVTAERALLAHLRAGCHAPVGVHTELNDAGDTLTLEAVVLSPDGKQRLHAKASATAPADLGIHVADLLLRQGAAALIARS